jgi:hypothetical protein
MPQRLNAGMHNAGKLNAEKLKIRKELKVLLPLLIDIAVSQKSYLSG